MYPSVSSPETIRSPATTRRPDMLIGTRSRSILARSRQLSLPPCGEGSGWGLSRCVRKRDGSSDDRQACSISKHHRGELAGGECGAQRSLVVVDDLRVLAPLRQPDRVSRCDRSQLAQLARRDEAGDLWILGEQHLHRGHLGCLNGPYLG